MLQLLQSLSFKLSEDSGTKPLLLVADRQESITEVDDLSESITSVLDIATGTVDQSVALGTINNPKMLYIKSDQAVKIKLNNTDGTDRELTLKENKASVLHIEYSALYVSNDTGSAAKVVVIAAGD